MFKLDIDLILWVLPPFNTDNKKKEADAFAGLTSSHPRTTPCGILDFNPLMRFSFCIPHVNIALFSMSCPGIDNSAVIFGNLKIVSHWLAIYNG